MNIWQAAVKGGANFGDRSAAYAMVDRKLSGVRRAEARKWIYTCGSRRRLEALMERLRSLPDLE